MSTNTSEVKLVCGVVTRAGSDPDCGPRLVIATDQDTLQKMSYNLLFKPVVVVPVEALKLGEKDEAELRIRVTMDEATLSLVDSAKKGQEA